MSHISKDVQETSICFVLPNAYDAVSGRTVSGHIGGAEIQVAALAHGLCDRGYPVSFVTWDEGQPDGEDCNGIKVYKTCAREAGLRGLRFFHPRWSSLWAAMRRADASIYCQSVAGELTGQVAVWCRLRKRHFVFIVMTDSDCDRSLRQRAGVRNRLFRRFGLRQANLIAAQTVTQQRLLRQNWDVEAPLVRPCVADFTNGETRRETLRPNTEHRLLWVGRFSPEKRLEWFLDLAEMCPELECDVVGGANTPSQYADSLIKRGAALSNVSFHGRVARAAMAPFYDRARLLVLTSEWEGFPSIFMEAWSHGIPTITTVDSDGLVSTRGLGIVGSTVADLACAAKHLIASHSDWDVCSRQARNYVLANHTVKATTDAFVMALSNIQHGGNTG